MLRLLSLLALLFSVSVANARTSESTAPAQEPSTTEMIEVRITRQESGNVRVTETRTLSRAELVALVGNGELGTRDPVGGSGPPPQPNPPLPGSLPDSTTSIDIHQRLDNWTRDTTYGRVPGGDWFLVKDVVEMHGLPKCNPNDDQCGQLPN